MKPKEKIISMRVLEIELYDTVRAQAKAEGMLVKDWIDRALHHELARVRKEQGRMEADPEP